MKTKLSAMAYGIVIKLIVQLLIIFNVQYVLSQNRADSRDLIAVICVNDFHGAFVEDKTQGIPGAGNLYSLIKALKNQYPQNLVVAVGDNFGGSYFSNKTQGKLLPKFFDKLGIRVSAIGNHEFDNGIEYLKDKWSKDRPKDWNITYVCSNLYNKGTKNEIPSYLTPDTTCVVQTMDNEEVKVRLVGLVTKEVTSTSKCKDVGNLYSIEDKYDACISELLNQKSDSADITILLAHIGTKMQMTLGYTKLEWNEDHLDTFPSSLTAIASGHSHDYVCGWMKDSNDTTIVPNGRPIVQGGLNGKYVGLLLFQRYGNRWVPVNPDIFSCDKISDDSEGRKEIDNEVNRALEEREVTTGMRLKDILVNVNDDMVHDRNINKNTLTALGSYVCKGYANAYREYSNMKQPDSVVIAFSHFGGIRRSLRKGRARVVDICEVLPFESDLVAYKLTGEQIFEIVKAGFNNRKGRLQMNNLKVEYVSYKDEDDNLVYNILNLDYIVPDGADITIRDSDEYIVVADTFITTGGDGYPLDLFPKERKIDGFKGYQTTPAFLKFIKNLGSDMTKRPPFKSKAQFGINF